MKTFWGGCRVAILLYLAVSTHALDKNAKEAESRIPSLGVSGVKSGLESLDGADALREAQDVIELGKQIVRAIETDDTIPSGGKEVIANLVGVMERLPEDPENVKEAISLYKEFLASHIPETQDSEETPEPDEDGDVWYDAEEGCPNDIELIEDMMDDDAGHLAQKLAWYTKCAKTYEERMRAEDEEDTTGGSSDTEPRDGPVSTSQPAVLSNEFLQLSARSRSGVRSKFIMSFLTGIKDFVLGAPVNSGIPKCPINSWISNNVERVAYLVNRYLFWQSEGRSHATARVIGDLPAYVCPPERQFWTFLFSAKEVSPLEVVGLGSRDSLLGVEVFIGSCAILWMITASSGFTPKVLDLILKHEEKPKSRFFKKEYSKMTSIEKVKHCSFNACRTVKDICLKINSSVELDRVTKALGTAIVVRFSWYLMRWITG